MIQYEKYKDSGIALLGEIPENWDIVPFKSVYRLSKGLTITKAELTEKGVAVISYGQIHSKLNNGTCIKDGLIRYVPNVFIENNANSLVNEGDVIFADTSEDLDGCGNCVYVDKKMILFAGYHTIIAKNISRCHNKYLPYLFQTDTWRNQIRTLASGVKLFSISQKILASTSVIIPTLSEQQAIAEFLDRKCLDIDELVSLQKQMIKELQAYKQSVITETVTKGLNKNAPLKDSGIEWIGEIPANWGICKLQYLSSLKSGYNLTAEQISDKGNYPVFGGNGLRGYYDSYFIDGDYILIGRQGALCGNINYASGKFWATEHAVVCFPIKQYAVKWFGELLRTMNLNQYSLASAQPGLAVERIKQLYIPLPLINEQQEIADYLDTKCTEIDKLIAIKKQKIVELKEYKKSVIFEYVTGKKQVSQ